MSNQSNVVIGVIAGIALGAVAGLLLAPESGAETRAKLKEKSSDLKDSIQDHLNALSEHLDNDTLQKIKDEIDGAQETAKEEYQEITNKIKALEAEIEAKIKAVKNQWQETKNA